MEIEIPYEVLLLKKISSYEESCSGTIPLWRKWSSFHPDLLRYSVYQEIYTKSVTCIDRFQYTSIPDDHRKNVRKFAALKTDFSKQNTCLRQWRYRTRIHC